MSLLEFPIRRYPFTLIIFLCLAVLGWFAFTNIAREEDPNFKIPVFFVTAIYPGADPKDLERLVAKPIEDRIAELDDVKKIETTVVDGVASIGIEFNADADADKKNDEVTREVNALRPTLPADIAELEIRKWSPGLVNIVELALVSEDAPYRELEDYARELKDTLKAVDGIRTSESWGFPTRELRVEVDLKRMAELGVTPGRVIEALQSENANIPAGFLDLGPRSFSLKTSGSYTSLDEVRDTVVSAADGRSVRVRDLANVSWDTKPWSYFARYGGKRAVIVTANQKDGYNILTLRDRVNAAVDRFEKGLPKRIKLESGFEQARNVSSRLSRLYTDFGIAIALVSLTLLPLGWRAAGIVMISIPLSLAFGLTVLYFTGYSINQISIAGFVVALGLLVDDSIVVVENIARHLREGKPRAQAALDGTKQIFVAIIGCTATLIFAFVPLAALPGGPGKFIRVLPVTVMSAIVGSLLIALFIIPFIASRFLKENEDPHGNKLLQRVMGGIHRYYRPALHYCLARPKTTVAVAIGGSILLSAGLVPFGASMLTRNCGVSAFGKRLLPMTGTSAADSRIEPPIATSTVAFGRARQ
jgi:multidrug efflux pump subunit AcrB